MRAGKFTTWLQSEGDKQRAIAILEESNSENRKRKECPEKSIERKAEKHDKEYGNKYKSNGGVRYQL